MCGIVGAVGTGDIAGAVFEGLRRLEYRGYDSAGLAIVDDAGIIEVAKAAHARTSLAELKDSVDAFDGRGARVGVGHTRWATHGAPVLVNAHPHLDCTHRVAVVHNGIVENFRSLREELLERGHRLVSDTDTEVIAHLLEEQLVDEAPDVALASVFARLVGHMAIAVALADHPGLVLAIRRTSPLMGARSVDAEFVASDVPGVLHRATEFFEVPEDEVVAIGPEAAGLSRARRLEELVRPQISWTSQDVELGGYASFYEMELAAGAEALSQTVASLVDVDGSAIMDALDVDPFELKRIRKVVVVGAGTSYHAGLVGRFAIEHYARVPVEVDVASEYRYRDPIVDDGTLVIAVSQSGESLDTIVAVREAMAAGARAIAITNVVGSQLARVADGVLYTRAGPEVSVAATKTHLAQLAALELLALWLGELRGVLFPEEAIERRRALGEVAQAVGSVLEQTEALGATFRELASSQRFFFIGRNVALPVAMEGALKLKELSYLPAEAYAAGELKHGPIAMLDREAVVVALVPADRLRPKALANLEEVKARGATLVAVVAGEDARVTELSDVVVEVPATPPLLFPFVGVVPLQVFAGTIARERGLDLDRPRNLAKTVTVE
ncbi:glucosamine/fructose-6-phosphate aminotransferase, isomerizing [Acidimicrobium ferrooxidans DSM 10331]|uniref:Glutamine--fructose-6-phosphate aminotransferase [isomerizing] n=1 Tax=Acidimicrobium ferrooxidans (strain DSM 10331 / JCM 15462 / NBRC 103882 / ICP) TaxID=525909 RepID=C7M306_ACIFD|nr:glutamine--fructose-6-phosphate transaminase (isomerizing) [Acidimicrobium ferrooxidans]ACU53400.1 glucosamine/fructose-6-phosphate aminotransferase, isomerizing [Acidimicrobium ferrooxidans DSM 10331]